jgi:hypothetical protein
VAQLNESGNDLGLWKLNSVVMGSEGVGEIFMIAGFMISIDCRNYGDDLN